MGDPGVAAYTDLDIHWIPSEYHSNPASALLDSSTDCWALGTTIWEIFSFGTRPIEGNRNIIVIFTIQG